MAVDPRIAFRVAKPGTAGCPTDARRADSAANRKSFLSQLRKVGDLEFLNDVGFGQVGEGLRVLAKVSDSIRTGKSAVPGDEGRDVFNNVVGTAAEQVDQGANAVFDAVGISEGTRNALDAFQPGVVNRAQGQAEAIFGKVKQGNFNLQDIPEVFSDIQNLATLGQNIFTQKPTDTERSNVVCDPSPYATDLIAFAPKYKFLFVVELDFTAPYTGFKQPIGVQTAFVVKHSTRPNISFDYEEVNMYNYWTRIPKRTIYEPMTMRFYDDNYNMAMRFYDNYLKVMSPIANMDFSQNREAVVGAYEEESMSFGTASDAGVTPGPVETSAYAASLGALLENQKVLLRRITLYHVYREGRLMNVYRFFNPKILSMELDELDMSTAGDGNEFSFQFAYDAVNIIPGYEVDPSISRFGESYNLEQVSGETAGATYPIRYQAGASAAQGSNPGGRASDLGLPSGQQQSGLSSLVSNAFSQTPGSLVSSFV